MNEDRDRSLDGRGDWTRRRVLQGLALAGLAMTPLVGRIAFSAPPGAEAMALDRAAQRLRTLFAEPDELEDLGRQYLAASPLRPDRAELLRQILPLGTSPERIAEMPIEQLRSGLGSSIQEDLRDGRLLAIEGWLLSDTELRLAALIVRTPA